MLLVDATYIQDVGKDVLVQPDGKIVIVGDTRTSSATRRMFLSRLGSDGTTLWTGNTFSSGTTGTDVTFDAVLQSDGKVVVTGYSSGTVFEAWVVRLQPQFSDDYTHYELDTSFSQDGRMQLRESFFGDIGVDSRAIALQPDGKIVIAGNAIRPSSSDPVTHMLVARIETNGTLDADFGVDGTRQVALEFNHRIPIEGQRGHRRCCAARWKDFGGAPSERKTAMRISPSCDFCPMEIVTSFSIRP